MGRAFVISWLRVGCMGLNIKLCAVFMVDTKYITVFSCQLNSLYSQEDES